MATNREETNDSDRRLNRRRFLAGSIGIAGAAVTWPAATSALAQTSSASDGSQDVATPIPSGDDERIEPFFGEHQAGIATPAQDRLVFASLDFAGADLDDLTRLLRSWTEASASMTQGQPVTGISPNVQSPPPDTGEAAGLGPSHLTITFGFGPELFSDRIGLADMRPEALVDLPPMPGDRLNPAFTGGSLCIQSCANDPQVAFHAVRNLVRIGRGLVSVRWMQLGFGRTSSTVASQATPRNLMGFKDGTNNVHGDDPQTMSDSIWVGDESDQPWMAGGTYMVSRRIRMRIESWDRVSLEEQQKIFGRKKTSGAPLTGEREFDPVDLKIEDADGDPIIDERAHIRLAAPDENGGARMLRRGYSFTDGVDHASGELDAGLFFIAFQKDPRTAFIPIQRRLASNDLLTEYLRHNGSAIFACPPGVRPGGYIGEGLVTEAKSRLFQARRETRPS